MGWLKKLFEMSRRKGTKSKVFLPPKLKTEDIVELAESIQYNKLFFEALSPTYSREVLKEKKLEINRMIRTYNYNIGYRQIEYLK